ncbi:MAG: hypothetical protein ACFFD8_00825 [Candidatus Thorarchaeota archaeon]
MKLLSEITRRFSIEGYGSTIFQNSSVFAVRQHRKIVGDGKVFLVCGVLLRITLMTLVTINLLLCFIMDATLNLERNQLPRCITPNDKMRPTRL